MKNYVSMPIHQEHSCRLLHCGDISASIPAKYGYHCHDGLEILYVHKGTGNIVIDCTPYRYKNNSIVIFQPYQIHGIFPDADSVFCRSIFLLSPETIKKNFSGFGQINVFLSHIVNRLQTRQVVQDSREIIDRYIHFLDDNGLAVQNEEEKCLIILHLLFLMSQYESDFYTAPAVTESLSTRYVHEVTHYIEEHYQEEYSLDTLADHLNLSKYHLTRIFKQSTGITISDYYLQYRIRQAKLLLSSTDLPVHVISDMAGFSSASYFTMKFQQQEHISPHKYRLKNAAEFI